MTRCPITCVTRCPIICLTKCPITYVTRCPIICVTKYPITCLTKCPIICLTKCPITCVTMYPITCLTKCPIICLTKCPVTCVTKCPIICLTKCLITCVTKCPIFQEDPLYSRRSSSRIADLYSRPYDHATTWPSYWHRYGDRRDGMTSYDQRKRSRLSRQRGYSVYGGYNGSLRPVTPSWYGGWGYDGRAKRKHPYGYVTAPGRYPMPYVYPMAYYLPHTYAAAPSPMYY